MNYAKLWLQTRCIYLRLLKVNTGSLPPPPSPWRHPHCLRPFCIPFLRSRKGWQQLAICIYLLIVCLIEKLKLNDSEASPPTCAFAFYASFYKEGDEGWFTLFKAILKGNVWRSICRAGSGCTSRAPLSSQGQVRPALRSAQLPLACSSQYSFLTLREYWPHSPV